MVRPKSEEKRLALLNAAAEVIAEQGLAAAPTSQIAKRAGVAEGTLFRYFSTKDELLNALYLQIKQDMCYELAQGYTPTASFKSRFWYLWERYIDWGLKNPAAHKAIDQLTVSSILTNETLEKVEALFPDLDVTSKFSENQIFAGREDFANAFFDAVARTTIAFASKEPDKAQAFKASGFSALWKIHGED